jgi:hypothetical protein
MRMTPHAWRALRRCQVGESVRDFFSRYVRAVAELDFETLETMIHPDFVGFYPQSGERFRGWATFRAQLENYPGGLDRGRVPDASATVIGADERWAISPGYTVLPLAGPERYTTIARALYPDGSRWWVVSVVALKDGKIHRADTYFAPDFDPPEWRRGIAEIVPRGD